MTGMPSRRHAASRLRDAQAVAVYVGQPDSNSQLCGAAHVRDHGWSGNGCANPGEWREVGTTGLGLPMEAVRGVVI
ncbi:hypothetical protein [Saccharothrix deserti]|uniref:hypothetical protein n=1 Tax=Saccharothrix deserti TaxID=2593674 RepID=UPI00131D16F7|nr:hypothetical protein [Saccharothrix deserti]